jgi:hypothetical protein
MAVYSICRRQKKNFQSFAVICRKPHVASSIYLCATIFQNPEWTLWTNCKISKSGRKKGNIHKQKTEEGNWYCLDNNNISISAAIVQ